MRIITGKYRGKKIDAPEGLKTRPTLQRAKETMFNMMPHFLEGTALDVFSGSGQLGIEALSRGCDFCYFNEINNDSRKTLLNNLKTIDDRTYQILSDDYRILIENLKYTKFDVVLIDPPYPIAQESLDFLIEFIDKNNMLSDGGIITGEIPVEMVLHNNYENFKLQKEKKFSKLTTIWQYRRK